MFGGHGLYQAETFFGIIHKGRLYFKVDASTVAEYRRRKMKPFRPNANQTLKSYYQVPAPILEERGPTRVMSHQGGHCPTTPQGEPMSQWLCDFFGGTLYRLCGGLK
jgi:TfoX/Sxy family transcriptional regulator of competence genes